MKGWLKTLALSGIVFHALLFQYALAKGSAAPSCSEASGGITETQATKWAVSWPSAKRIAYNRQLPEKKKQVYLFAIEGHECCHLIEGYDEDKADFCAGKRLGSKVTPEMIKELKSTFKATSNGKHSGKEERIRNIIAGARAAGAKIR